MSYRATVYNVMIASPSDVQEERDMVRQSLARWNAVHSEDRNIVLLPIGWETQSSPEMGDRPQNILNRQLLERSDLLVGLFWTRVGTPTDNFVSGSVEEIRRHVDAGKPAMLYFSNRPVRPDDVNHEQQKELRRFKEWCRQNGLLGECEHPSGFREKFYDQLQMKLNRAPYFRKKRLAGGKNSWVDEKEKYKLCEIPGPDRVMAYGLKDASEGEPIHYLCPDCFETGKSILQRTHHGWYCGKCGREFGEHLHSSSAEITVVGTERAERVRRERFDLDMPPLERIKRHLKEPDMWSSLIRDDGCNGDFYHEMFPEFTIRVADAENWFACHQEWTRGEIRKDNNHAGFYELYYHQTRLAQIHYVSFDDHKKSMVAPDWEPCGAGRSGYGRFYFYRDDSIRYAVQKFYATLFGRDDSLTLRIRGEGKASNQARSRWGSRLQVPVLRPRELERFLGSRSHNKLEILEPSTDESEQYQLFLRNLLDFEDWRNGDR